MSKSKPGKSKTQNSGEPLVRLGLGYDIHRFSAGRKLVLGGVTIPGNDGLLGHSDADVLLHAICDALLGAAALGDIGRHFPDTDKRYDGISSLKLLAQVGKMLQSKNLTTINVDATVILERPKIAAFKTQMQRRIAKALKIRPHQVSVKATTNEGLGALGNREGCAALAIAAVRSLRKH
ncbi:MAG: 2-C-methyl-D-erythritol 2,4-cyclodiphosphate synthase [Bacteroidota bacterium]